MSVLAYDRLRERKRERERVRETERALFTNGLATPVIGDDFVSEVVSVR